MIRMAWTIVITTTFACWAAAAFMTSSSSSSSSSPMDQAWALGGSSMSITTPPLRYKEIRFSTVGATELTYGNFMKEIRNHTGTEGDVRHRIRVMRNPSTVPDSELFLLVVITNSLRQSVTFALKVTNLELDAYLTPSGAYFFSSAAPNAASLLFTDAKESHALSFGSDYDYLQREGGINRTSLELGMANLDQAITSLVGTEMVTEETMEVARSLLVVIQMVTEAARYKYIQSMMSARIRTGVSSPPDSTTISLENNWERLSAAIQNANDGGTFANAIELQSSRSETTLVMVDNVKTIAPYISLMPYVCTPPATAAAAAAAVPMLIRPIVAGDAMTSADQLRATTTTCAPSSTTTRIVGLNGLCADANRYYNNRYPLVRVNPCINNIIGGNPDQLWTLKMDGTIMTSYFCFGHTEFGGRNPVSYACAWIENDDKFWQVSADEGTIKNLGIGQVVAKESSEYMVFENRSATIIPPPAQIWRFTNVTERVTSIVGFRGMCLRGNATTYGNVWIEECEDNKLEQKWALYVDGSVRPEANRDACLAASQSRRMFGHPIMELTSCNSSSSAQRWEFTNDGTILNLLTGRVMDVTSSNPSLKTIILYPPGLGLNQQWLALL